MNDRPVVRRKKCAFCGGRDLTAEHVLPRWLNEPLGANVPLGYRHGTAGAKPDVGRDWPTVGLTHTVKRFCRHCNNDWMAELEARAKPIVGPLVKGEGRLLSVGNQALIALWAAKTVMVFDLTHENYRTVADEDMRLLFERKQPPPATHVWLAAYGPEPLIGDHKAFRLPPRSPSVAGYGATLVLGHLVIQVFRDSDEPSEAIPWSADMLDFFVPIWPIEKDAVNWPPRFGLDKQGLEAASASP